MEFRERFKCELCIDANRKGAIDGIEQCGNTGVCKVFDGNACRLESIDEP